MCSTTLGNERSDENLLLDGTYNGTTVDLIPRNSILILVVWLRLENTVIIIIIMYNIH